MARATSELGEVTVTVPPREEVHLREHRESAARERILDACYELFSHRGIRAVGIDEVVAHSNVAKATLYRHFSSKDELVLAFLDLREQRWTRDFVEAEVIKRGSGPEQRLLAIFDVYDEW